MSTDLKPFLQTCRDVVASLIPNGKDYDNLLHCSECLGDAWYAILPVVCRGLLLVTFPISVPVCTYLLRKWAREDEARQAARLRLKQLAEEGGRRES